MTYKRLGATPISDLLPQLKSKAPSLYKELASRVQAAADGEGGSNTVRLSQSLAQRLDDWLAQESAKPPYKDPFNDEMAALVKRESARLKNEREALARFEYWRSQGLRDIEHNANAITNFIAVHPALKGKLNGQAVDIAVDFLGPKGQNSLQWQSAQVATAPVTPKVWKPGDTLPLDATESMLRQSSVDEIKAWKRRKQGG